MASHMDLTPTQKLKRASIFLASTTVLLTAFAVGQTQRSTKAELQPATPRAWGAPDVVRPGLPGTPSGASPVRPEPPKYDCGQVFLDVQFARKQYANVLYWALKDEQAARDLGETADHTKSQAEAREIETEFLTKRQEFLEHKECNQVDRAFILKLRLPHLSDPT